MGHLKYSDTLGHVRCFCQPRGRAFLQEAFRLISGGDMPASLYMRSVVVGLRLPVMRRQTLASSGFILWGGPTWTTQGHSSRRQSNTVPVQMPSRFWHHSPICCSPLLCGESIRSDFPVVPLPSATPRVATVQERASNMHLVHLLDAGVHVAPAA